MEREVMKIKINKWVDLDGKVGDFNLRANSTQLIVYNSNLYVSQLLTNTCSKEVSLAWLKAFGFDVEFETQIKLTDREFYQLKVIPYGWIARNQDGDLNWFEVKPDKFKGVWTIGCKQGVCELFNDMFEFITFEASPLRVVELFDLERG